MNTDINKNEFGIVATNLDATPSEIDNVINNVVSAVENDLQEELKKVITVNFMTHTEKVKQVRDITMSPMNKINEALKTTNDDVDAAIKLLIAQKQADTTDMANRIADNNIVYSYVHNNKIGAMIILSCQTDFVARNETFICLAKDICMHIVSSPNQAEYIDESSVNEARKNILIADLYRETQGKPQAIQEKIVNGKMQKWYSENCLVNQKFIKDDSKTIGQLLKEVSSTVGEKIVIKQFVRLKA